VHRDIKPENIMLVDGDSIDVRLMDFGVAQLEDRASITLDGDLVGTLAYMSPEQGEGKNVDSRSDVYSLALTLYEGLTRKNPLKKKRLQELLLDVSRPDIPPLSENRPDLPAELSDALLRAMARDSYARPDAGTFGRMLARIAKYVPEVAEIPDDRLATRVRERLSPVRIDRDRLSYLGEHFASAFIRFLLPFVRVAEGALLSRGGDRPANYRAGFYCASLAFRGRSAHTCSLSAADLRVWSRLGCGLSAPRGDHHDPASMERPGMGSVAPGSCAPGYGDRLGLALLPLAGALARRWGALVGLLSGFVLVVTGGLAGWTTMPYTFNLGPGAVLRAAEHAISPWTVLLEIARLLDSYPELAVQILLFALFGLPWYALWGRSRVRRMWGASTYLIALLLAFVLVPILVLGVPVQLGPFLVTFIPCAIIAFLAALLISSERVGTL
jgi:hypothetical protein